MNWLLLESFAYCARFGTTYDGTNMAGVAAGAAVRRRCDHREWRLRESCDGDFTLTPTLSLRERGYAPRESWRGYETTNHGVYLSEKIYLLRSKPKRLKRDTHNDTGAESQHDQSDKEPDGNPAACAGQSISIPRPVMMNVGRRRRVRARRARYCPRRATADVDPRAPRSA